ncbi:cytochrome c-type biogenesis transmembrane protein [Parvularcula bermudensis HTCC2503]|uniref:Cytochrome c-type biogenesis transmembrane protein n=1 Tax=Parvularcula bermudensis (strain ATCC BAA-594 / HTCC2503 / KCTC 12087) TaxID=314260 RepID=E0TFV6_PARBH|nr:c-type cytochrome biogenesis protein CcmI [Parvularcula bermudensis]ADM09121.1 cytochrome c-type biogenesis transmembrane protein [Parvularcula bermudensis HTCC2503]
MIDGLPFTLFAGLITLTVMGAIALPLLRPSRPQHGEGREIALYEDQLAELDRDRLRGVMTDSEAKAARTEIERRLLVAYRRQATIPAGRISRTARLTAIGGIAAIPLCAWGLFGWITAPTGPGVADWATLSADAMAIGLTPPTNDDLSAQIAELEERVASASEDLESHVALARAYVRFGDDDAAIPHYAIVNRLTEAGDPSLLGEMAASMIRQGDGFVGPRERQLLERALDLAPRDPRAVYYLALGDAQSGALDKALTRLKPLVATAPVDAPWLPRVDTLVRAIEADLAADDPTTPPAGRNAPTTGPSDQ